MMQRMLLISVLALNAAPALAHAAAPRSFFAYCKQKDTLPEAQRRTVDLLLRLMVTIDCQKAASKLGQRSMLDLSVLGREAARNLQDYDLAPLENLSKLRDLRLRNRPIKSFKSLQKMPELNSLYLAAAKNISLENLKGLQKLERLVLEDTEITDWTELKAFPSLKMLSISARATAQTERQSFKSIASLKKIEKLSIRNIPVRSFSFLQELSKLRSLNLQNTGLTSLEKIPLPKLVELIVADNPIRDLRGMEKLKALEILRIFRSGYAVINNDGDDDIIALESLQGVEKAKHLLELNIHGTRVSDLSPLVSLPRLQILDISATPVKSFGNLNPRRLRRVNTERTALPRR